MSEPSYNNKDIHANRKQNANNNFKEMFDNTQKNSSQSPIKGDRDEFSPNAHDSVSDDSDKLERRQNV